MSDEHRAISRAMDFVNTVELPAPPSRKRGVPPEAATPIPGTPAVTQQVLNEAHNQALVVGSTVISFAEGVTAEARAETKLTQVLFFRHRQSKARLRRISSKVTINAAVPASIRSIVAEKIAAHTSDYIRALDI